MRITPWICVFAYVILWDWKEKRQSQIFAFVPAPTLLLHYYLLLAKKISRWGRLVKSEERKVNRQKNILGTSPRNFFGWGAGIRTPVMTESESVALPLGDTPIIGFVLTTCILYQKIFDLSIGFWKKFKFFVALFYYLFSKAYSLLFTWFFLNIQVVKKANGICRWLFTFISSEIRTK